LATQTAGFIQAHPPFSLLSSRCSTTRRPAFRRRPDGLPSFYISAPGSKYFVDRPTSRAGDRQIEEDETEHDRHFALVQLWLEALREVGHEICRRHLARGDEGDDF